MSLVSRVSLVSLLVVSACIELVLNRIGLQVAEIQPSASDALHLVERAGTFFYYLTTLFGMSTFAWGIVSLARDRQVVGELGRMSLTVVGLLAGLAMGLHAASHLVPALQTPAGTSLQALLLNTTFGFLILTIVGVQLGRIAALQGKLNSLNLWLPLVLHVGWLGVLLLNATVGLLILAVLGVLLGRLREVRSRMGLLYLATPIMFHALWLLLRQLQLVDPMSFGPDLATRLFRAGEQIVVVGAFACYLFFAPLPRPRIFAEPLPLAVALAATGLGALVYSQDPRLATQIAYHGFRINLPEGATDGAVYLAALFVFTLTVASLYRRGGTERAMGVGLLLIGISGYELEQAYQLLLTATGMLVVMRATMVEVAIGREGCASVEDNISVTSDDWQVFVNRLTNSLPSDGAGRPRSIVVQHGKSQVTRVQGVEGGQSFGLRILCTGERVLELEVIVGSPPRERAIAVISRKELCRGELLQRGVRGPRVAIEGPFELRDRSGTIVKLLFDQQQRSVLSELKEHLHGRMEFWPGEGLIYRARPLEDGWPVPLREIATDVSRASIDPLRELVTCCLGMAKRIGAAADVRTG
jgi:hypothetical protein